MWKAFARWRFQCSAARRGALSLREIEQADSVLFAVFARYGDSVIAFKLIREFAQRYPDKRYQLVTTPQALPYAQAIIAAPWPMVGINKRRNFIQLARLLRRLRREPPALGLNPWSHGADSEILISYARRYFPYREFAHFTRADNLYARIRAYLKLPPPGRPAAPASGRLPPQAQRIVVAPFSTDVRKSLNRDDLVALLAWLRQRYPQAELDLAMFPSEAGMTQGLAARRFYFGKSRRRSERFLALLRQAELFVGVDAGPLHLADALGVPAIGIFGPTAPETILDLNSGVVPLRLNAMQGWFCDIRDCKEPRCLHRLLDHAMPIVASVDFIRPPRVELEYCRAESG